MSNSAFPMAYLHLILAYSNGQALSRSGHAHFNCEHLATMTDSVNIAFAIKYEFIYGLPISIFSIDSGLFKMSTWPSEECLAKYFGLRVIYA